MNRSNLVLKNLFTKTALKRLFNIIFNFYIKKKNISIKTSNEESIGNDFIILTN